MLTLVTPLAANQSFYSLIAVRVVEGLFEVNTLRLIIQSNHEANAFSGRHIFEFVRDVEQVGATV